MTKYNYFKVPDFEKHNPKNKGIVYGRSKKDIGIKCSKEGFKVEDTNLIQELNFKNQVIKMFSEKELFDIRTHYKGMEKAPVAKAPVATPTKK